MNFAVTLLLFRPEASYTQILSISRGSDLDDWGLVGGKVEAGETFEHALNREVREEAGAVLGELVPVYTGLARTRLTTTYLATDAAVPDKMFVTREGTVAWKTPWHLIAETCTYRDYNIKMFEHLRLNMDFMGHPQ